MPGLSRSGLSIRPATRAKVVRRLALASGVERFSTHTTRHLCLTDLARMGWELHAIASFAGHRPPFSTSTSPAGTWPTSWPAAWITFMPGEYRCSPPRRRCRSEGAVAGHRHRGQRWSLVLADRPGPLRHDRHGPTC
ncbi:tyrosine-type recombinase/integrase [Streptomyces sp. NPDC050147]|uniref:tyrosine-type recombinase/integrase n=1 Tax=Streptomyces sp. NPDC050147 TaxID=3155513 RepID=UPI003436C9D7